ncbi:YkgJ family cysteine cluster protein [Syntrophomonas palmitatica]|uniref:YkgJ family cysteine cluster protein n=1 Tax=Syntrophomonas palmitatica TaxID=402877 RepID=UPI000A617D7C|nr:YkgJ family cysteine cluster protein [Syntrophomonas palmitatica]
MNKIELKQQTENGQNLLNIEVIDISATVADLLQVWQPLCDDEKIVKLYAEGGHASCRACKVNCCNTAYVIPDLVAFRKMAAGLNYDYHEFIDDYCQTQKRELGLLRLKPNPCVFLREDICTIYPLRSLICRFYICTPLTGSTEQLIYEIAWTGAAATCIFAEEKGLLRTDSKGGFSSFDLLFKQLVDDYRSHPGVELFLRAADYDDIPLAPFLIE